MSALTLRVNGKERSADVDPNTPLLWVLRDHLGPRRHEVRLRHRPVRCVHGAPERRADSLVLAAGERGRRPDDHDDRRSGGKATQLHPLQAAWIEHDVPQCGYCQAGQLMSAAALLKRSRTRRDADIDAAMNGNICRCGTYPRIRKAIHAAAKQAHE